MAQNIYMVRSRSHVKIICKGHPFVVSVLHLLLLLLLLRVHEKFADDAIATFCCSVVQLQRQGGGGGKGTGTIPI